MEKLGVFIYLAWGLYMASALEPIAEFFRQTRPCFRTRRITSECNVSLADIFMPNSPNLLDIKPLTLVYLFTPGDRDIAESLHDCGGNLPTGTSYDPDANTEIFIHGWLDGVCRTAWMREMKEQLFERAKRLGVSYNVILVDWSWGNLPDYYVSSQNSKIVGEQVGFVIKNIMRRFGIGPGKFHVIGHSFGAISCGFVGRSVNGLRRITALDPSYAPFIEEPADQRVTYTDATIVDVIHSNSGDCFPITHGDYRQLGHADFFPNGGTIQTSCISYLFISFLKQDYLYALISLMPDLCFHVQSIQYYKVSINPKGCEYVGVVSTSYLDFLIGSSSNEWAVMGMDYELYHKSDGQRRIYYLTTSNKCPYYDDHFLRNKSYPFKTSSSSCPA